MLTKLPRRMTLHFAVQILSGSLLWRAVKRLITMKPLVALSVQLICAICQMSGPTVVNPLALLLETVERCRANDTGTTSHAPTEFHNFCPTGSWTATHSVALWRSVVRDPKRIAVVKR